MELFAGRGWAVRPKMFSAIPGHPSRLHDTSVSTSETAKTVSGHCFVFPGGQTHPGLDPLPQGLSYVSDSLSEISVVNGLEDSITQSLQKQR